MAARVRPPHFYLRRGRLETITKGVLLCSYSELLQAGRIVVPAAAVAYIVDGKVQLTCVYGERPRGDPARLDSLFNIASLSKPITAEVLLRLASHERHVLYLAAKLEGPGCLSARRARSGTATTSAPQIFRRLLRAQHHREDARFVTTVMQGSVLSPTIKSRRFALPRDQRGEICGGDGGAIVDRPSRIGMGLGWMIFAYPREQW